MTLLPIIFSSDAVRHHAMRQRDREDSAVSPASGPIFDLGTQ